MLELYNRPRVIKVTSRVSGVAKNVAQIRKDNLEIQGVVESSITSEERKELNAIVKTLRDRQGMFKESVLIRLIDILSEAITRAAETKDEQERALIRHFIENALRLVRKSERKP